MLLCSIGKVENVANNYRPFHPEHQWWGRFELCFWLGRIEHKLAHGGSDQVVWVAKKAPAFSRGLCCLGWCCERDYAAFIRFRST